MLEELPEDWLVVMVEPREELKKIDKIELRLDFCIKLQENYSLLGLKTTVYIKKVL